MALTYTQSADLMKDVGFTGRIKVACLKYAAYIVGEAASTAAHSTRVKWAQTALSNPDATAMNITPVVVMDAQVQLDGSAITDAALQTAVETSINKVL